MVDQRNELLISSIKELELADKLAKDLYKAGYNASNSIIVTVSTDYSSILGQLLRHKLSFDGEMCSGFGVDVPYPDEDWNENYVNAVMSMFKLHAGDTMYKNIILVEAGVIRGGNYTMIVDIIKRYLSLAEKIVTVAMFENVNSRFKSDFVGEFYDNNTQDLTFWWEEYNNHWN